MNNGYYNNYYQDTSGYYDVYNQYYLNKYQDTAPVAPKTNTKLIVAIVLFAISGAMVIGGVVILILFLANVFKTSATSTALAATTVNNRVTITATLGAQNGCGVQAISPVFTMTQRIINGEKAVPNSWPWAVSIRVRINTYIVSSHLCGGTLIYSQYIITAAHCVVDYTGRNLAVVIGVNTFRTDAVDSTDIYYVSDLIYHQRYDPDKVVNDIAILKLERAVKTSTNIGTICLPSSSDHKIVFGKPIVYVGWGSTTGQDDPSSVSLDLRQGTGTIVNTIRDECFSSPSYTSSTSYCSLDLNTTRGTNACFGDSGGAMMYNLNGAWFIYGIISYIVTGSDGICTGDVPIFYTVIPNYLTWIGNTIGTLAVG